MLYLVLLSLLGYCALLVAIKYTTAAKAPIFAICIIAILEYFAALIGILRPMTYIILFGGGLSLLIAIVIKRKLGYLSFIKELFQPGLVIFFLSIIILYPFSKPIFVSSYDEFSHWALYTKYLVQFDKIPINTDIVPFYFLPPASSLVQYYFARLLGGSEGLFYWAQSIFLFATISCASSQLKWKNPFKIILTFSLAVLILLKYNQFNFFNLYSDSLTAFVSFSAFACYVFSNRKHTDVLKILPILFIIPLVRESAGVMGIFVFLLILIDQIVLRKIKLRTKNIKTFIWENKHIVASLLLGLAVIVSMLIWGAFVKLHRTDAIFMMNTRGNPRNFVDTIRYITDFFENVNMTMIGYQARDYRLVSNIPMIYLIALGLIMGTSLLSYYRKAYNDHRNLKAFSISMTTITVIYILGLLYVYLFRFGKVEADVFAALNRYLSTLAMFIMLCTTSYLFSIEHNSQDKLVKNFINYTMVFMLLLTLFSTNPQRLNIFKGRVLENVDMRKEVYQKTHDIAFDDEDKVYVIYQGDENDLKFHITRYEFMVNMNPRYWHLGNGGHQISSNDFKELLIAEGYNYVFIGKDDIELWETYGDLFDITDGSKKLYEVSMDNEQLLTAIK